MNITIKKFAVLFIFAVLTTVNVKAQESNQWMLDQDHTSVNFEADHFFSTVNGNFTDFNGKFNFDPDDLSGSSFEFIIPVSSIETNNEKRNQHLKSDDFFAAAKYPEIHFKSSGFERISAKKFIVKGDLTMKNMTKKVAIPFEVTGKMEHPMMKGTTILGLAFTTSLNRADYHIGVGDWASDMVVGDEVLVDINMELNQN